MDQENQTERRQRMNNINQIRWESRSKTKEFERHIGYAREAVEKALSLHKLSISWSAGKDSTAVLHLVLSVDQSIPVVIQFDDCDWPEKRPYADRISSSFGFKYHAVEPDFSVFGEMLKGKIGEEDFCSTSHKLTKDSFLFLLREKQVELGCSGSFLGLRAEESKARKAHLNTRGELYTKKNGETICCPIARWTAEDVFTYLYVNNIEINPCYYYNFFKKPEEVRLSWAIPTPSGLSHGELEHLKMYNPRQFIKMKQTGFF